MAIETIPMFKGICDDPLCKASPSDEGDYFCWSSVDQVISDAQDSDWYTATAEDGSQVLFCESHTPSCDCKGCDGCDKGCKVLLRGDDWGKKCEDCFLETDEGKAL